MTTVGYGDFTPVTFNEKLFQILIMMISTCIFAYIIGSVGNIISYNYDLETDFQSKILIINNYLIEMDINETLRLKVKTYLENVLRTMLEERINDFEILGLINKNLREEIILELNGLIVKNCEYFGGYEGSDKVCILLTRLIKDEILGKNDIIFEVSINNIYLLLI